MEMNDIQPPKGSRYAVISPLGYLGTYLLLCIPLVGLILTLVWAFGGAHNQNRRNLARAMLIGYGILVALYLLAVFALGIDMSDLAQQMQTTIGSY